MGTLYVDTGGAATNSGSSDNNVADLTGTACTAAGTTVTLDGSPNLSGLSIVGANQSTINIAGATNANRTIFWITAFDNALKTVTVDVAPTGLTTNAWKIGGQYLWPSAATVNVMEGALGLGENSAPDILQFNNSPATKTVTYLTARVGGNSTKGKVIIRGKSGVRPVLNITNTAVGLTLSQGFWHTENIEVQQNGASGNAITNTVGNATFKNVKVSDAGAIGISHDDRCTIIFSEISGCGTSGITSSNGTNTARLYVGNYIHDNAGDGILASITSVNIIVGMIGNIIDTNAGRGIFLSGAIAVGAGQTLIMNNTIYGNLNSGLEITDADNYPIVINNIFKDNGDTATEYNWEQVAGTGESIGMHAYNCFNISGGVGGGNLLNVTADATDITTDPLFTNAAGGDFSLGSTSPCKATGFPGQFLGSNLGYMDMGAVQRQESGGAAGMLAHLGMTGGVD